MLPSITPGVKVKELSFDSTKIPSSTGAFNALARVVCVDMRGTVTVLVILRGRPQQRYKSTEFNLNIRRKAGEDGIAARAAHAALASDEHNFFVVLPA